MLCHRWDPQDAPAPRLRRYESELLGSLREGAKTLCDVGWIRERAASYELSCAWWDVVEYARKALVTGAMMLFPQGSALQLIVELAHIPPNIAGITFLSFGNGAPDVFARAAETLHPSPWGVHRRAKCDLRRSEAASTVVLYALLPSALGPGSNSGPTSVGRRSQENA